MFFIIFMLLSCFVFIHSAAVDVMSPAPTTPRGQIAGMGSPLFSFMETTSPGGSILKTLKASPGDTNRRLQQANASPFAIPPGRPPLETASTPVQTQTLSMPRSTARCRERIYTLFAACSADNSETASHQTLLNVLMNQVQHDSLDQILFEFCKHCEEKIAPDGRKLHVFYIPLALGLNHYSNSGVPSPSRDLRQAFENSLLDIFNWAAVGVGLNGCEVGLKFFGELIKLIHNSQFSNHPFGHTQCKVSSGTQQYKFLKIEIAAAPEWKIRHMIKKRRGKIEKLTEWLGKMDAYQSDQSALQITRRQVEEIDQILRLASYPESLITQLTGEAAFSCFQDLASHYSQQNVQALIVVARQINQEKIGKTQAEERLTARFLEEHLNAMTALDHIRFIYSYYGILCRELTQDASLKGAFVNVEFRDRYQIAQLLRTALEREAARPLFGQTLFQ